MSQYGNVEKKRVTIYSVAKEAGVSLATVSRVINESDVVKENTKKKVQEAIVKLGYKPNAVAQGLALKKTTSIALVVPDGSFTYIDKVINGLLDTAKIYKYNIILHTATAGINEMNEIIDNVVKSRADGLIQYNDAFSAKEMEILNNFQIPTVYLGNKGAGDSACCVYIDYEKAVYELVGSYLDKDIDDIVIIDDRKNPTSIDLLIRGASKAFEEHGKTFGGYITIPEDVHNSYEFLLNYFAHNRHKLVITYRDSQAIAVINTCTENNIRIPDETEVVCIKDSRYTDMFRPRISSFIVPSYDLGALAMRIMTKLLSGDIVRDKEFKLNYVYKAKDTTK